jgi:hypothetical protein
MRTRTRLGNFVVDQPPPRDRDSENVFQLSTAWKTRYTQPDTNSATTSQTVVETTV